MQQTCLLALPQFRGPTERHAKYYIFDIANIPHPVFSFADGVKIFPKDYLLALFMILAKSTSRALAILRQVMRVGLRLLFSTKLMVARLKPVISASVSCDTPVSFRTFINSAITLTASFSDSLSLIHRIIRHLQRILYVTIVRKI